MAIDITKLENTLIANAGGSLDKDVRDLYQKGKAVIDLNAGTVTFTPEAVGGSVPLRESAVGRPSITDVEDPQVFTNLLKENGLNPTALAGRATIAGGNVTDVGDGSGSERQDYTIQFKPEVVSVEKALEYARSEIAAMPQYSFDEARALMSRIDDAYPPAATAGLRATAKNVIMGEEPDYSTSDITGVYPPRIYTVPQDALDAKAKLGKYADFRDALNTQIMAAERLGLQSVPVTQEMVKGRATFEASLSAPQPTIAGNGASESLGTAELTPRAASRLPADPGQGQKTGRQ